MKKVTLFISLFILTQSTLINAQTKNSKAEKEPLFIVTTNLGAIKIKLYNETPLHRDNFIKLVEKKFYDSLLFHRVIKEFMIQGGDPASKKPSSPDVMLGDGDVGYTVPAEFNTSFIHKKGALAAARQGDDINPAKASSGCQFYIVHGKNYSENELMQLEGSLGMRKKQEIFQKLMGEPSFSTYRDSLIAFQNSKQTEKINELIKKHIEPIVEEEYKKLGSVGYTPEQRKIYNTIGGTPHLDRNYTVFGEVVEGLEVVDKIAGVEKNQFDRPLTDVRIISVKRVKK